MHTDDNSPEPSVEEESEETTPEIVEDHAHLHKIQEPLREDEDWLQRYLAAHPELLPMRDLEGIESNLRLVGRELEGIDLLFVDREGLLTVVETKLEDNAEARRRVVAQLQDYAAMLSKWDVDDLCFYIAKQRGSAFIEGLDDLKKLSEALHRHIGSGKPTRESMEAAKAILANYVLKGEAKAIKPVKGGESFLKRLDAMLRESCFRLVIVTYRVSRELLDLLNYVNSTTSRGHQLIAVELSKEDLSDGSYLVPHLVGAPQLLSATYYRVEPSERVSRTWRQEELIEALPPNMATEVTNLINAVEEREGELECKFGHGQNPNLIFRSRARGGLTFLSVRADSKTKIGWVLLDANVGSGSRLPEPQKRKLRELYARTPFLKEANQKIQTSIEQGTRWPYPWFKLEDVGAEGQRWKILLDFLIECHKAVS